MKSRTRPGFYLKIGCIYPTLCRLRHIRGFFCSLAESWFANAEKQRMNKCLPVPVPRGPSKPLDLSAQGRTEVALAFRRAAQNVSRLSLRCCLLCLCGTTETPPLVLMLFRLLGAGVRRLRPLPKRSSTDQVLRHGADDRSPGEPMPSDLGGASALAEPNCKRLDRKFRGIWAAGKSGDRFERRRLMQMTHRIPDQDSR